MVCWIRSDKDEVELVVSNSLLFLSTSSQSVVIIGSR